MICVGYWRKGGNNLNQPFQILLWLTVVCAWACSQTGPSDSTAPLNPDQSSTHTSSDMGTFSPSSDMGTFSPSADAQVSNEWTTQSVYEAMEPLCSACHGEGHSSPYFESLSAFVDGIVANEAYIVLGDPDASEFLSLLVGTYDGPLPQMPPSDLSYADRVEGDVSKPSIDDLANWITNLTAVPEIDSSLICAPFPAPKLMHRLNRLEYNHSVKTILGTALSPADDFPSEDQSYGFDNIARALSVSPLLIEKYDLAAQSLAAEALPNPSTARQDYVFEAESEMISSVGAASGDGWNLWSNGSLTAEVTVPANGRYTITVMARQQHAGPGPVQASFSVDNRTVHSFEVTTSQYTTYQFDDVELTAGFHIIGINFLNDFYCPQTRFDEGACGDGDPNQVGDRNLYVDWLSLSGPVNAVDQTSPFGDRFLEGCDLTEGVQSYPCARSAMERFGRFAWRRPLTQEESDRLWSLASLEFDQPNGLTEGMRQIIHAILLSPHFIFRVEQSGAPGGPLSGYERATRLSMFLWRSTPTESLLDLAENGALDTSDGVATVASDMLETADPMIEDLANQWLLLHQASLVDPDYALFPDFDENLRDSMVTESQLVFETLFEENRPLLDIVNADFTFVNARLAQHYGLRGVATASFERIELPEANRKGILTHASWLSATSQRTRTSPVKRGKWVLEELLCAAPPPPPPSVEGLPEGVDQNASLRERLEQHRADPECATCHTHMDAVGFGLEQFDAVGAFRTVDGDEEIEPAGVLLGERTFEDAVGMADAIRNHPNLGPCVTNKILTYALGRGLEDDEFCYADDVAQMAANSNFEVQALIESIVTSPLFLNRGDTQTTDSANAEEASE